MSQEAGQETQRIRSYRYWLITWNNPPQDWKGALLSLGPQWYVGQLEQASTGTPHIQALLWYRNRLSNKFWKDKKVWSKAIFSDEVDKTIAYCTKEETRLEGPSRYGKDPMHVKQATTTKSRGKDWDNALELTKEGRYLEVEAAILIPYVSNLQRIQHLYAKSTGTEQPRGIWIVGDPGTGKSHYARATYPEFYSKSQNKWWDGYRGQKSVILDDLDKHGSCLAHYLKIWMDKYPFDGEIKCGYAGTAYTSFVVTSNYWPDQLFDDPIEAYAIQRRCIFVHFIGYAKYNVGADFGVKPQEPGELYFANFMSK